MRNGTDSGSKRSLRMINRREKCTELARIFRLFADEARADEQKAARYWDLACEYEAEAADHLI